VSVTLEQLAACGWVTALDRRFADALARTTGEVNELTILAAAVTSKLTGEKHVCADLASIAGRSVRDVEGRRLGGLRWPDLDRWIAAIERSPFVSRDERLAPLVLVGSRLYLYRYWSYERRLADELRERSAVRAGTWSAGQLDAALDRAFPATDHDGEDLQRAAAEIALTRGVSVISGGPGTGKTATVARIVALLIEQALERGDPPPRIAMVAPTGKAAARLKESVRAAKAAEGGAALRCDEQVRSLIPEDGATIHRTLGYQPRTPTRFRYDASNPLPVDVVVVDEASMVDLALMTKLVEAVPRQARLILLGDRDQLASVDAGSVLGDICDAGSPGDPEVGPSPLAGSVVQLVRSYRFGADSSVGRLASAINENRPDDALELLDAGGDVSLREVTAEDHRRLDQVVAEAVYERYRAVLAAEDPTARLARFDGWRILCAHRRGEGGAEGVNSAIEARLAAEGLIDPRATWYAGRPVMVTENDYDIGLFNGDTGLAVDDPRGGGLRVWFVSADGGWRAVAPSRLPAHETVFATTVHKAQGSEFDEVAVVLPPRVSPVVTRELLYTAVTRARERVTIFGSKEVVAAAIGSRTVRLSGLRDLLWGPR